MLNWDEYGKEEKSTPPVTPEIKNEAPAPKAAAQPTEPPPPAATAGSTEASIIPAIFVDSHQTK